MVKAKQAIVTGNNKGLGKHLTERLFELNYEKPDLIRSQDFDLSQAASAQALINKHIQAHGTLDLLINNVGNYIAKDFDELELEDWHEMMNSNLNSAFYMCRYALPYLRQTRGCIINIGFAGLQSFSPEPRIIAYQVAKSGLLTLTKGLAKAEAANGVRVNMMSPGSLENTIKHNALNKIPLGRLGTLDEAVDAVFALISNDYISGANLEFSGAAG